MTRKSREELEAVAKKIKKQLLTKTNKNPKIPTTDLLSTGITPLNLALSGRLKGGLAKGKYFFFVGDSESGKTFIALTILAEAANNPEFDKYALVYINVEQGALMDIQKYFGSKAAQRIKFVSFGTIQEFYFYADDLVKMGKPFILVLDSMDALRNLAEDAKFQEQKVAFRKGTKAKGSYGGVGKAKVNSENINKLLVEIEKMGSILIVISQTRDNIDAGGWSADKKTRAGGRALRFYATWEVWMSIAETTKREISTGKKKVKLPIGAKIRASVKKNRFNGKHRTVYFPIFNDTGIDDTGACVDYLLEWGHWKISKGLVGAKDLVKARFTREELIHHIEENNLERDLRILVSTCWKSVEAKILVKRKSRYE